MNVTKERRGFRSSRHSVLKDFLFLTACAQCSFTRVTHVHSTVQYRAWIFKLLRPRHRLHGIDSLWEIQFRCRIDSWRHRFNVKELQTTELSSSYIVCGGMTPLVINTFPTQIYDSCGHRIKSWLLLRKKKHFYGHGRIDSIFASYSTPIIDFNLHKPAQKYRLSMCVQLQTTVHKPFSAMQ